VLEDLGRPRSARIGIIACICFRVSGCASGSALAAAVMALSAFALAPTSAPSCAALGRKNKPEAISVWQGPNNESDVRKWILSYAILAPHSHNLQSWLVDLRHSEEITLYCDRTRLLPETDPRARTK